MDGRYGLTEVIANEHQRRLVAEASSERVARQASDTRTSPWRRVLRADIRAVIAALIGQREGGEVRGMAVHIPLAASHWELHPSHILVIANIRGRV
jgi:hypothetical protein